ncbi:MAG: hypothetical protein MOB07_24845 [Acidobacteria bacterium]|nr:hypothetical protein [Acidobacteriota bacterium]
MTDNRTETAKKFLAKEMEKLSEQEQQQLADRFAQVIGSWRFIICTKNSTSCATHPG